MTITLFVVYVGGIFIIMTADLINVEWMFTASNTNFLLQFTCNPLCLVKQYDLDDMHGTHV